MIVLSDENIQNEPAGKNFDTWIAKNIFNLEVVDDYSGIHCLADGYKTQIPNYSTDISAAWEVVEKMMNKKYRYVFRGNFEGDGLHWAAFDQQEWADSNPPWQSNLCESLPLAICRAALLAVREEGEK